MDKDIFSISEAAQYLGVFPLTLRNWEKKGLIKAFRTPGRHRRFKKSELDNIIGSDTIATKLQETIKRLEDLEFKNGRKEKMDELIKDLKTILEWP